MTTPDSSVLVAAFATWHPQHEVARDAVAGCDRLVAHAALETFAVLTRLPSHVRVEGGHVVAFLEGNFRKPWLTLRPRRYDALLAACVRAGVTGGAVYDALIGAAAVEAGESLVSSDKRARSVYEAVGAEVAFLE